MSRKILDQLREDHLKKKHFSVVNLEVGHEERELWVRIKIDPEAFRKSLFDGNWADPKMHPKLGQIRVLKVLTGHDDVTRVIARQGEYLFAYPWLT